MTREEVMRADQSDGGMFAVIPSVVMQDPTLSMSARMLYGVITWRCNKKAYCWASNRTLGEDLGLSAKRVSALVSDLEAGGHVETEIIKDPETGAVRYRYIYPIVKSSRGLIPPPLKNGDTPLPENKDTPSQSQAYPPPKNEEDIYEKEKEERKIENTPKAPKGASGRKSKFDLAEDAKPLLRAYVGGDRELHQVLGDMIESRRELRAINSKRAIKMLLDELDRLSGGSRANKLALLRRAIASSWKTVYPMRPDELPEKIRPGAVLTPDVRGGGDCGFR